MRNPLPQACWFPLSLTDSQHCRSQHCTQAPIQIFYSNMRQHHTHVKIYTSKIHKVKKMILSSGSVPCLQRQVSCALPERQPSQRGAAVSGLPSVSARLAATLGSPPAAPAAAGPSHPHPPAETGAPVGNHLLLGRQVADFQRKQGFRVLILKRVEGCYETGAPVGNHLLLGRWQTFSINRVLGF